MKEKKSTEGYNPEVELAKGAKLEAAAYDKTQKAAVLAGKVTVGGKPGIAEIFHREQSLFESDTFT